MISFLFLFNYQQFNNFWPVKSNKKNLKKSTPFVAVSIALLYILSVVLRIGLDDHDSMPDMVEVNKKHEFITKARNAVQGLFPFLPVPCRRILLAVCQSGRKGRGRKPAA